MSSKQLANLAARYDGQILRRLIGALGVGSIGGAVFAWFDLPLPWMLGAMAATMGASLGGADMAVPQTIRKPMIALVGVALGSAFTPDRLDSMIAWLPSVAAMPVYVVTIGVLILLYLRRLSGFDHKTAFFASMPGGLSEMIIIADQIGGDMRNVALFHATRLVLIVFSIPLLTSLVVTVEPTVAVNAGGHNVELSDLLMLGVLIAIGWILARPLRLPAPSFMGSR